MVKELQIKVITTKRAYGELERDGFIETVTGKGSYVSAKNKEFLKEKRMRIVEEKLAQTVSEAKGINLDLEDLYQMVKVYNEEE